MEKDINALDDARSDILNKLFGESENAASPIKKVIGSKTDNLPAIQNEIFYVLEKHGYTREQATPAVANLMENLTRVKTADAYKFKHI